MSEPTQTPALPECWQAADDCLGSLPRLTLYGPPGTGKTYYAMNHKPAEVPAYRVICTEDMTTAQIEGMFVPRAEGWQYAEGAAIQAWRTGGRLVIDEVNRANGDVLAMLLAMTDTAASSVWQHPDTGEMVRPHPRYSVVMTMNGEPDDLDEALVDRFPVAVRIDQPHPEAVALLPEHYRNAARMSCDLPRGERVSLRALMACAELERAVGLSRALSLILPRDAEAVRAAIEVGAIGEVVR